MAETKKTVPSKREQFENAVYDLGLRLIEDYRTGRCRDREKTVTVQGFAEREAFFIGGREQWNLTCNDLTKTK